MIFKQNKHTQCRFQKLVDNHQAIVASQSNWSSPTKWNHQCWTFIIFENVKKITKKSIKGEVFLLAVWDRNRWWCCSSPKRQYERRRWWMARRKCRSNPMHDLRQRMVAMTDKPKKKKIVWKCEKKSISFFLSCLRWPMVASSDWS